MSQTQLLPAEFQALEPFVELWSAPTTADRDRRRADSTAEQRQAFFDAGAPLLDRALAYLDAKPLTGLDEADRRLLNLVLSLGHVQMAVEVHREMEPRHAASREAMTITRSITDLV